MSTSNDPVIFLKRPQTKTIKYNLSATAWLRRATHSCTTRTIALNRLNVFVFGYVLFAQIREVISKLNISLRFRSYLFFFFNVSKMRLRNYLNKTFSFSQQAQSSVPRRFVAERNHFFQFFQTVSEMRSPVKKTKTKNDINIPITFDRDE